VTYYTYTCPECGAVVRLEQPSAQLRDIKVCVCEPAPVETEEEL